MSTLSNAEELATRYLHEAVKKSQRDLVVSYLSQPNGMDVNARDGYGMTALMWAVGRGYQDIVKVLLEHGADVEARNELLSVWSIEKIETGKSDARVLYDRMGMLHAKKHYGWTALMWAARNGQTDLVNLLTNSGANINAITKDGWTALVHAIDNKHVETAHLLLERGADPNLIEDDCSPAVSLAAGHGFADLVQAILDRGGDVNALNNWGHNALCNAVVKNQTEVLKLLLKRGLDANAICPGAGEWPPLYVAAENDAVESAEILLDYGADINFNVGENGATALQQALDEMVGPRVARFLIERGADTQGALETVEHFQDQPEAAELIKLLKSHPKDGAGS